MFAATRGANSGAMQSRGQLPMAAVHPVHLGIDNA
jgi:hypothetical protein